MESDHERHLFYLARIATWSFEDRTGPEFSAEDRGEYTLEEIPPTPEGLNGIELKPEDIAHVLRGAIGPRPSEPRRRLSEPSSTSPRHQCRTRTAPALAAFPYLTGQCCGRAGRARPRTLQAVVQP
ncbi:hypothetical protein [Streptomyces sp. NPDC059446]|uniref:hypothetical protein n=1 Tax=Streptomyces sp. NPDC059446 TaxID=3346833 RepID=UPI0036AAA144